MTTRPLQPQGAPDAPTPPAAATAAKPGYMPFPAANPDAVADWIVDNLDIGGMTLVTSGPTMTVWIVPDRIDRSAYPRVSFWERDEVTSADAEARLGGRSLMIQKDIDCQRKIVRTRYTAIYKANNLKDFDRGIPGDGSAQLIAPEMYESLQLPKVCLP